ncbi:hypothetical protein TPL01_28840 [Sulfuriferula plumbiphila]|uniref:Uncharacterized protein n=1 Tax=Sulfuriferula plumbiphila TaxID=171865 RepID=A0A512LBA7_9PROT|nr:hypothetical protein [Sulfuriferula plumbiphila]BBP04444.1 hypothetical protein SFPGR_18660 [Sulfuriferula plumbiphila]GEP31746.1 hypothetical protein TPL01_28840 [Sulfuriferula plumbiphila]
MGTSEVQTRAQRYWRSWTRKGGIFLRSIGAARAAAGVGLMNLSYNLSRIGILIRTYRQQYYANQLAA